MTGPEHYKAAQQLLASADIAIGQFEENGWATKRDMATGLTAQAQVHTTLALTAATADLLADDAPTRAKAWIEVTR